MEKSQEKDVNNCEISQFFHYSGMFAFALACAAHGAAVAAVGSKFKLLPKITRKTSEYARYRKKINKNQSAIPACTLSSKEKKENIERLSKNDGKHFVALYFIYALFDQQTNVQNGIERARGRERERNERNRETETRDDHSDYLSCQQS